jgi:c-di-GMP-binding flagellar brake protein YcgR
MESELLYGKGDGEQHPIEVVLHLPNEPPVKGKVHDVFIDGVAVVVAKAVSLPLGARYQLTLSIDACERLVTLTAVVRTRSEGETDRRYGFRFVSKSEIDAQLPLGLYAIFNRRRAERVHLAHPVAVAVWCVPILAAGALAARPVTSGELAVLAHLEGASRTGCSLLMNRKNEERLTGSERLLIRVDISPPPRVLARETDAPDTMRRLSIGATVHHRMLTEDQNVRYGCEFDRLDRDSSAAVARFVSYLLERERQSRSS